MIGKVIKAIAIVMLILCIGAAVYYGMSLMDISEPIALGIMLVGVVIGFLVFCMVYGYGHLIDTNDAINRKMETLLKYAARNHLNQQSAPKAAPAPVASAPVTPAPAPVMPVAEPSVTITPPAPVKPAVSLEDTVVLPADLSATAAVSGWECANCGAKFPTLTPFCKNCGHKRI